MSLAGLRATLVLTLGTLSPLAWAGGSTGSTGGPNDSGGGFTDSGGVATMGTGTDTGTGSSAGTDTGTDEGSSSSGECGECTPSTDPVQIVSPADGAVVPRTFDVRATAPHTCSCDAMCCSTLLPSSLTLRINVSSYEACNLDDDCDTTDHTFTVENLPPGEYQLDVVAPVDLSPEFSTKVNITVEGELLTGDSTAGSEGNGSVSMTAGMSTTGSGSGSSGDTSGPAVGEPTGGCGCRTEPGPRGALQAGLLALVLGAIRRRRRPTA